MQRYRKMCESEKHKRINTLQCNNLIINVFLIITKTKIHYIKSRD